MKDLNVNTVPATDIAKWRTGLLWNIAFWFVFFTVAPLQLICLWLSKGLAIISDLLQELCYRAWFERTKRK